MSLSTKSGGSGRRGANARFLSYGKDQGRAAAIHGESSITIQKWEVRRFTFAGRAETLVRGGEIARTVRRVEDMDPREN